MALIDDFFVCLSLGLGGDSEDGDTKDKDEEAERERLEAIKEAEDRRKEKHRKMEEEREKMRQDIRDKVIQSPHPFLKRSVACDAVCVCVYTEVAEHIVGKLQMLTCIAYF